MLQTHLTGLIATTWTYEIKRKSKRELKITKTQKLSHHIRFFQCLHMKNAFNLVFCTGTSSAQRLILNRHC